MYIDNETLNIMRLLKKESSDFRTKLFSVMSTEDLEKTLVVIDKMTEQDEFYYFVFSDAWDVLKRKRSELEHQLCC